MAKANVLQSLYTKRKSPLEFNFDMLTAPPLLALLTPQDINDLNRIARSVKLAGKIDEKYRLIDQIMTNRGFVKLHAGTNRVVYRFIEDQRFVIKVAVDRVGLGDNPAEYKNQFLLKPFVTKVFEVSPCGTVGLFERVDAIMSREEFLSVADDIFNLITKFFVGKYVLEDFGSHYFMNWAIRKNYGPVLLDFPYVYELDGNKLYCNAKPIPGRRDIVCGGEIDYDDGFNNLICTKCGRPYQARDLKKAEENKLIIVGGKKTMRVQIKIGKDIILDSGKKKVAKVIEEPKEKVIVNTVKSRLNSTVSKVISDDKPSDSIFNKKEDINKEKETDAKIVDQDVETKDIEEVIDTTNNLDSNKETVSTTMNDELESVIDTYQDYEDDYSEYDDYDQYLSNRQRSNKRNKKSRKGNSDFSDF